MSFWDIDLNIIQKSLIIRDVNDSQEFPWLLTSYERYKDFWNDLLKIKELLIGSASKSIAFSYYNFYEDILVKNQDSKVRALGYFDEFLEYKEISYQRVKRLTDIIARRWQEFGVEAGMRIAIVYPFGIEFLVSLLAGLKLGLVLCIVSNKRLLQESLKLLKPDFVSSDIIYRSALGVWRDKLLPDIDIETLETEDIEDISFSHTYKSNDPVFLIPDISLTSFVEINADEAYLYSLRDAIITFALAPFEKLASIGFDFLKSLSLLISCLSIGASYIYINENVINSNPNLLKDIKVKCLGISDSIVNSLITLDSLDLSNICNLLFRDPSESIIIDKYQKLVDRLNLKNVLISNVRIEPCLLSSSLFSSRIKGKVHQNVMPSAGLKWVLTNPLDIDCISKLNYGCLCIYNLTNNKKKSLSDIICQVGSNSYLYTYPFIPIRSEVNKRFPINQFMDIINSILSDRPVDYTLLLIPYPEQLKKILLIFVGDFSFFPEKNWKDSINKTIMKELGREFLPDEIVFFYTYPRYKSDGTIDSDWCYSNYLTGLLYKKTNIEVYKLIARLRRLILIKEAAYGNSR